LPPHEASTRINKIIVRIFIFGFGPGMANAC
jgi:hypothetical protein